MVLRKQVEIRDEDVEPLQRSAWKNHRSFVEQAGYLLHLAIQKEEEQEEEQEELARLDAAAVAEVA